MARIPKPTACFRVGFFFFKKKKNLIWQRGLCPRVVVIHRSHGQVAGSRVREEEEKKAKERLVLEAVAVAAVVVVICWSRWRRPGLRGFEPGF